MKRLQLILSLALVVSALPCAGQLPNGLPAKPAQEHQLKPRERPSPPKFTPEEREKRRQQIKDRLARQVAELDKKKANGTISEDERLKLRRLQQLASRFRRQPPPSGATVVGTPANNSSATKTPAKSP